MESAWFSLDEDAYLVLCQSVDNSDQLQLFKARCYCQMVYYQAQKYVSIIADIFEKYCLTESTIEVNKEDALREFGEKLQGIIYDKEVVNGDENRETREERRNIVFSIDTTRKMATHFSFSFIRYFDAYKYCFTTFPDFKDVNIVKNVEQQ